MRLCVYAGVGWLGLRGGGVGIWAGDVILHRVLPFNAILIEFQNRYDNARRPSSRDGCCYCDKLDGN